VHPQVPKHPFTRRRFLKAGACVAAGAALYSGEIERHWIEIAHRAVTIPGLNAAFDGLRVAQLSDIHFDEFTEPIFLSDAIHRINEFNPDAVFLTGDFVTHSPISKRVFKDAEWRCAEILNQLQCRQRYASLGNHDVLVGKEKVIAALTANAITVINNSYLPVERGGGRFWLASVEDPLEGHPDPEAAIPASIRNVPNEPVILLCHGPDYADNLLRLPAGQAVALMLSGHTHGGQVCLPFFGPLVLPRFGQKYVKGWFQIGNLQLHVSRGLGTVGVPFRFNCPPEITFLTLRAPAPRG
jgi:predicted MPP superfamily phosphohydrolase